MKKIIITGMIALGISVSGCSDFLKEESYGSTTAIFGEENGIKALVYQSYTKVNNLYGGGGQWPAFTEHGADLFLRGGNFTDMGVCDYYGLDASNGNVSWLWNHCYKALANINTFFETIDDTPFAKEEEKDQYKAEMKVMRSLFLWIITEMWGDTYLPRTTDEVEGMEARRSTRADFYKEIIGGLEEAITMLPDKRTSEFGRIDMPSAKAFLARMYLYNEQFDEAMDMASQVIDGSYGLELSTSLKDLWNDSKRNKEFIWTTEFVEDESFRQSSYYWQHFAMFIDRFAGVKTECGWTGYGGCGAVPSLYYISLFDHDADLRWSDLHQWVWYYNDPSDDTSGFPNMQELYADTALYLSIDPISTEEKARMASCYTAFDVNDLYDSKGVPTDRKTFIGMTKFDDNTRPGDMSTNSDRNYPVLRLAEMYLIRAEAKIRSTNKQDLKGAVQDIMTIRQRAIKSGYEKEMTVTEKDMTPEFILDERGRELAGEFQRRLDLKRLGKLVEHVKLYNPDAAANIKEYHKVCPIPQTQFDGMPDWTTLGQNEGY
ncbi:RagB/SusD family nutrient uptake outer membrane protein [Parabacteroides sp. GYB001]|uniref:RagB/SusD family nutrient uptake outer membrane protein n=1 Tax=Parabacteroides leei TaxID=2939491 RepID=UPI002017CC04|nr:RagB/SusD family nutrient uptake outer membrane protein [Parabacteroides leei]MCL3852590.1 RagB/SusD family nutrient uptake outer membrane protein [Parabacteroides leei]